MSKHHGKQDVFSVENTSQAHHREKQWCHWGQHHLLSFLTHFLWRFPKQLNNDSLALCPLEIYVEMLWSPFSAWKNEALQDDRARWQQGGQQPLETMFPQPLCLCLWCECSLPVICICNCRKKPTLFLPENQKGGLATVTVSNGEAGRCYNSHRLGGLDQCTPLSDVTHTAQTHGKSGRLNTSQWKLW